jgi:hypothetical protein
MLFAVDGRGQLLVVIGFREKLGGEQCSSKDFVFLEGKKMEGKEITVLPLSFRKTKRILKQSNCFVIVNNFPALFTMVYKYKFFNR